MQKKKKSDFYIMFREQNMIFGNKVPEMRFAFQIRFAFKNKIDSLIKTKEKKKKRKGSMLRTAIDIKNAIDTAKDNLAPIGTCDDDYISWYVESGMGEEEYYEIEDEDDEKEKEEGKKNEDSESDPEKDSEDEDEKTQKYKLHYYFNQIIGSLEGKYYSEFVIPERLKTVSEDGEVPLTIRVKDEKGETETYEESLEINQERLRNLFERADDSPYGDMKNIETKVDKEVRNAKELTDISVSQVSVKLD